MTPRRFTVVESREAMLVTADNLAEVAAWCGGVVDEGGAVVVLSEIDAENTIEFAVAEPGDYLVTDGHRWWDVDTDEFERQSAGWEETP